jgi:transcriptional regulator with XRE-family HTH domain
MTLLMHSYPGGLLAGPEVFAKRLRELMREKGLTAYAVAKRAGITRQSVSYILGGDREPNWTTVRKLARALGVGVESFDVGEPEGMPQQQKGRPGPKPPVRRPKTE